MQKLLKIFEQSLWQLLGKVVSSGATFIVLGLVARNFGETGTGTYTLAVTYLAIFFLLADFGFNAHVLRKFQTAEFKKLLGTRILWSGFLVVLAVGLLPFWPFTTPTFAQAVMFGSLAVVASGIFVTCNLIFQKNLRYDLSALAVIFGTIAWLLVVFWFIKQSLPVPYLLFTHFLSWLVISLVALVFVKKLINTLSISFVFSYIKKLFRESWPIAATLALNVVYFRADAFILSSIKGPAEVGIYNVAYQVFQSILVLPTFIMNSFYPMMLETLKNKIDRFQHQIKIALLGLLFLSFSILLATYYMSPFVIKLITGSGFTGSVTSLQILSLGFPAYFLSALLMWVMVAKNMYKKMLIIYGLGLMVNITANLVFIPQYGYIAASWITGASEYFILALQAVILLKK